MESQKLGAHKAFFHLSWVYSSPTDSQLFGPNALRVQKGFVAALQKDAVYGGALRRGWGKIWK